jgi:hypothetical protein
MKTGRASLFVGALLALALAGFLIIGRAQDVNPKQTKLVANEFILKNAKGQDRAVLMTDKDGDPMLHLLGSDGIPRLSLMSGGGGDIIAINDGRGQPRIMLSGSPEKAMLTFHDKKDIRRFALTVAEGGNQLALRDSKGNVRFLVNIFADGTIKQTLFDQHDKERHVILVGRDGLTVITEDGKPRVPAKEKK